MKKVLFFIFILGFLITSLLANADDKEWLYRGEHMLGHVFVVSEWLPKENCEEELWILLKEVMALTKKAKVAV